MMICPLTLTMHKYTINIDEARRTREQLKCRKSVCAWWDEEYKQCSIKTIAKNIKGTIKVYWEG